MSKLKVHLVAAARPNFMKIAPLYHELKKRDWCLPQVVHSGQHYDYNMSAAFFEDLGLSEPDFHLGVGSGSHGQQTGRCLMAYEKVLQETRPDWVVVVGDVNSTMACALAARKLLIPIAHLEAGLRSFDRTMPEETNRLVTDAIADLLWTHSPEADQNLLREGIPAERIELVGNIMIDSLEMLRSRIEAEQGGVLQELGLAKGGFGLVTLHRPSNVDQAETLTALVETLKRLARELPLVFPLHPRTRERLTSFGLWEGFSSAPGIKILDPLGYVRFMGLVFGCRMVITDSGGVQEETTYLGLPCLTLRPNTERPVTVSQGTNRLVSPPELEKAVAGVLNGERRKGSAPALWDGQTAGRVAESLKRRS